MAPVMKYAGLPDLDMGTEIYETPVPELTETSTVPTDSTDEESIDRNPNFDKHGLNRDAARARFEPAVVDARGVNFSDTIDGGRRDYRTRSRRRRRGRGEIIEGKNEDEVKGDDYDDIEEEETVQGRLARLRRETAELQAEIDRMEKEKKADNEEDGDCDYEDTVDDHAQSQQH